MKNEDLEIDVLIRYEYMWCFECRRTIGGEPDEPVAVETGLG